MPEAKKDEPTQVDPAEHYRSGSLSEVKVPKAKCGAVHKDQNAMCLLDKGHEGHHMAEWESSSPHPTRFRWPN